jgi:hypothetical protein
MKIALTPHAIWEAQSREMLLRMIGIEQPGEFKVVNVYKTSKIDKYWVAEHPEGR